MTDCVIWDRYITPEGYGATWWGGRVVRAHRAAYEKRYGPVPDDLEIDHKCRNRACVNPEHLEAVTHAENVRRGDLSTLTHDQVIEIKASEDNDCALARRYAVTSTAIWLIRAGKTWKGVGGPIRPRRRRRKLSDDAVVEIGEAQEPIAVLAERFGVCEATIYAIRREAREAAQR